MPESARINPSVFSIGNWEIGSKYSDRSIDICLNERMKKKRFLVWFLTKVVNGMISLKNTSTFHYDRTSQINFTNMASALWWLLIRTSQFKLSREKFEENKGTLLFSNIFEKHLFFFRRINIQWKQHSFRFVRRRERISFLINKLNNRYLNISPLRFLQTRKKIGFD